jgi:hypothetical protein
VAQSRAGLYVAALGVLAILIALLADPLGLSNGGFGTKHILLLVAGLVLVVGGLVAQRRSVTGRRPPTETRSSRRQ